MREEAEVHLSINEQEVSYSLETEKTLGEAATGVRAWLASAGFFVTGMSADGHDLLVANDVSQNGAGFDVDTNIVTLLFPDGRKTALEKMSKIDVAGHVLDEIVEIRKKSNVRGPKSEVKSK